MKADKRAPMESGPQEKSEVDPARRAFLGASVVVPPTMVMLLSTSMASPAIAQSAAVSDSDSDSEWAPLAALGALVGLGAVGAGANAAAPILAAGGAAAPAAALVPVAPAAVEGPPPAGMAPIPDTPPPMVLRRGERG